jgi:DNA mismatch repair ATPase MutS
MKITKIYSGRLRNEAHYQFFAAVIALMVKFPSVIDRLGDLFGLLQRLFAKEDEVVDYIRKSDYSAKIATADERLDNAVVGFSDTVRGALYHFREEVADAAQSLLNLLKTYGNIIRKNYDEELTAVTNLLQELGGAYADKVKLISGLSEWITEIKAASENVATLLALRTAEKAGKPQERMVNVRREVDSVYRDIVAKIEALTLVEGDTAYAPLINELNALVERFNKIRSHKTGNSSGKDVEQ